MIDKYAGQLIADCLGKKYRCSTEESTPPDSAHEHFAVTDLLADLVE